MDALAHFEVRQESDDFSALENFLAGDLDSPWRLAVTMNLGLMYYHAGYFSKCIPAYLDAWHLGRDATELKAQALADRAAGEYTKMLARLGRYEELKAFLKEVEGREFVGQATELMMSGTEGVTIMEQRPEIAFRCGPLALSRILATQGSPLSMAPEIVEARSSMKGMSLLEVAGISKKLGMNYQAARRAPAAPILIPSVIHWRVGHYAALVKKEGNLYLTQDPTFGNETWHTLKALEAEASGYFLAPPGTLPQGWSVVDEVEAQQIFGKGLPSGPDPPSSGPDDPTEPRGPGPNPNPSPDPGPGPPNPPNPKPNPKPKPAPGGDDDPDPPSCDKGRGMAIHSFHIMLASLRIQDTPVGYRPPYGYPVHFTVTYTQREATQPSNFAYSNLGKKWNFDWLEYISDDPSNPAIASRGTPGGGAYSFSGYNSTTNQFAVQFDSNTVLTRTATTPVSYTLTNPDGSKSIYAQSDGSSVAPRKVFLTQRIDPFGNAITLTYDAQLRITRITDALGQQSTLSYGLAGDIYKITQVTDPFGRSALFSYDASGRLVTIQDVVGIQSTFTYDGAGDFIKSLTTPYGTTSFTTAESNGIRTLTATDPAGDTEVLESFTAASSPAIAATEASVPQGMTVRNDYLNYRNSFYWNKKQWREFPRDYTKAHLYHWLHTTNIATMSRHLESEKPVLQNRIWYAYPGQTVGNVIGTGSTPIAIGRVIEGGTQRTTQTLNALNLPTSQVAPLSRTTNYEYAANNIDILSINRLPNNSRTAINAGGASVGSFEADSLFVGGGVYSNGNAVDLSGVTNPAPQSVYQSEHNGTSFSYIIPNLEVGISYQIRLHFAEIYWSAAAKRVFNVTINGSAVLSGFDIFVAAGNTANKAIVREFNALPDPSGTITVGFTTSVNSAKISGIEVIHPSPPGPFQLAAYTWNAQHLPLTYTDAAGQVTTYTWNANGQMTTVTNAKNETTAFTYYSADVSGKQRKGRLQQMDGALAGNSDVITFDYDAKGRVASVTGPDGYFLGYTYDDLDRPLRVTFPDATFTETAYQALDPQTWRDRLGRTTSYVYNSLRQIHSITDPASRTVQYRWCKCGALNQLIDAMGRVTIWKRDAAGRPTYKQYADGSKISYAYQPLSGRLQSITDEKGQVKTFSYNLDDSTAALTYTNAAIATPSVAFTYDTNFLRLTAMADGTGTTSYAYHPIAPGTFGAGQLASETSPLPNSTITYTYDELGRATAYAVNGVGETDGFDAIGRVTTVTNPLGTFNYTYVGATNRTSAVNYPNGMTCAYSYHPLTGDFRLKDIIHTLPGNVLLSQHSYIYNAVGNITRWTQTSSGGGINRSWLCGYDGADQLTSVASQDPTTFANQPTGHYAYTYDPAGNRLTETIDGSTTTGSYNVLNQLGTLANGGAAVLPLQTYEWDAENRLISIDYTGTNQRSEFSYDGWGRRARIVEKTNGVTQSDRRYLWVGTKICETRDSSGLNAVRKFFRQGETMIGSPSNTNYFYTRDHLGTIREAVDAGGTLSTRYDYQPFGKQAVLQESLKTTFSFTGHFNHAPSGLYLTLYRGLDSAAGRWLSRDPIEERDGPNVYSYVENNPINFNDPFGDQLIGAMRGISKQVIIFISIINFIEMAQQMGNPQFDNYNSYMPEPDDGQDPARPKIPRPPPNQPRCGYPPPNRLK